MWRFNLSLEGTVGWEGLRALFLRNSRSRGPDYYISVAQKGIVFCCIQLVLEQTLPFFIRTLNKKNEGFYIFNPLPAFCQDNSFEQLEEMPEQIRILCFLTSPLSFSWARHSPSLHTALEQWLMQLLCTMLSTWTSSLVEFKDSISMSSKKKLRWTMHIFIIPSRDKAIDASYWAAWVKLKCRNLV